MTNQDKAQQPDRDAKELTDEALDQVSGGVRVARVVASAEGELEAAATLLANSAFSTTTKLK